MEAFLINSHVLAGLSVLISGVVAMITRKAGKGHRVAGNLFFWGMFWIFASTLLLVTFVRFHLFLLVIGIFSFYLSFTGYRVLKRKKPGEAGIIDWTYAFLSVVAGLGLMGYGAYLLIAKAGGTVIIYPIFCLLFGFFTFDAARKDIQIFRKPVFDERLWWKYHHMQAMLGAYIAAVTAFMVQGGARLLPAWDLAWTLWLLPAAIGSPMIARWIRSEKSKATFKPAAQQVVSEV